MTKSATTLFYFGIYVLITGITLIAVPSLFVSLLQLPELSNGWARIIGLLVTIIGAYDLLVARNNVSILVNASVYLRMFFAIGVTMLIISDQMPIAALPLALIDAITAGWTFLTLRAERRTATT